MTDAVVLAKEFLLKLEQEGINVTDAYLFGSHARGIAKPHSDIDVCVVSPAFKGDFTDNMVRLFSISRQVDDRIEPIPFDLDRMNDPFDPLVAEIRRYGVKLIT